MQYKTGELKIDQFILYLNAGKINLIPPFQRGHVWRPMLRAKLIENIIHGKPIPAIFLYREESGETYAYNILDGKQRLESLMLFVGNRRQSLLVNDLPNYFYEKKIREQENFKVNFGGKKIGLKELDDETLRNFREYVIPTIEITLSGDNAQAALDEMIDLFVDINQYGEKVKRFDIVKAMSKDPLLKDAFNLIALTRTVKKDTRYKAKHNDFTFVLKRLEIVANLQNQNSQVDRMWEMIVELVLFVRDGKHRAPVEILKSFIKAKHTKPQGTAINKEEVSDLRQIFAFLKKAYKNRDIIQSRLVTNQIHFYAMITAIIADNLLEKYNENDLISKLAKFGNLIDGKTKATGNLRKIIGEYGALSAKHTTHPGKRLERREKVTKALELL